MDLKIFDSMEFGSLRTIEKNGEVLFCASDVATALGYARPADAISAHCRSIAKLNTTTKQGNSAAMNFIKEDDVLSLISKCKTKNKKYKLKFKNWLIELHIIKNTYFIDTMKETEFISLLEEALFEFGIKGIKQFRITDYKIDFYIPEFKIAVEYDESQHSLKHEVLEDKIRQNIIEKELDCKFIRCDYKDSNIKNIMKVVKKIL